MFRPTPTLALAATLAVGLTACLRAAPLPNGLQTPKTATTTLSAAEFQKLHAALAPQGERWEEIPWETDLGAARQRAAREKKPLLMWIMDGHPLGCT